MVRLIIVICMSLVSCNSMKVRPLEDNITRVPADNFYFDKKYANQNLRGKPEDIDENSLYVDEYYIGFNNEIFNSNSRKEAYRFFKNGAVNKFFLNQENINTINLNPNISGYRGFCYKKDGKWKFDLVAPITELRNIGTYKYEFLDIKRDTIKFRRVNDYVVYVFSRQPLNNKNRQFSADW